MTVYTATQTEQRTIRELLEELEKSMGVMPLYDGDLEMPAQVPEWAYDRLSYDYYAPGYW